MEFPYITVVMPLFNKKEFVKDCIKSVLLQQYSNYEIIVVDDGSTDGGKELIEYEFNDRVRLIEQSNEGPGAARNRGVDESKYELIAFIDADDLWAPQHLEELAYLFSKCSSAGLFSTRGEKLKNDLCRNFTGCTSSKWRYVDYALELSERSVIVHTSSVLVRRKVFYEVGGFKNFRPGQDVDLWLRIALKFPVVQSESITSCHRLETGGIMDQSDLFGLNDPDFKPKRISDINPLLGSIYNIRESYPIGSLEHAKLTVLINSKLSTMIRIFLVNGQSEKAKYIGKLFLADGSFEYYFLCFLLRLPDKWLSVLVNSARRLKAQL